MNRTAARFAIYAGTAAGVFWLPFHVPPFSDVFSISQVYHFNNQAAIVALLAGLVLAAWWHWRNDEPESSPDAAPAPDQPLGWWPLLAMLAVSGVWLTLVSLASLRAPLSNAIYFVNRLFCLQDGLKPHQDFEFAYGPLMLYIPAVLRRWTGLSVNAAYLLALWLFAWGGLLMLWWVVRQARTTARDKTVAFLLLAGFPGINPEFGIEYTMTRYTCGLAALVAARIVAEKLSGKWVWVAACHAILVAAVFLMSPEIGLAFLAALIAYYFLEYRAGSTWLAYAAAMHVGMLACLAMLAPQNTFLSVRGFGAGSNNLPLFPSPYLLLYVGSLLVAVPPVLDGAIQAKSASRFAEAARAALGSRRSAGVFGTLTVPFAVHAVAMIPATLGRADAGHVLYNGTAVFLLSLLMPVSRPRTAAPSRRSPPPDSPAPSRRTPPPDSPAPPRPWAISRRSLFRVAFLLVFPVMAVALDRFTMLPLFENLAILQTVEWSKGHPSSVLAHGLERVLGEKEWEERQSDLLYFQGRSLERQFPDLNRYGKICEPIGRPEIFIVLGRHHALQPEYYYGITDESPSFAVSQKLKDVRSCNYAILPGFILAGLPTVARLNTEELSRLLMFPMGEGPMIAPPNREFFDYLRIWFVPLGEVTPGHYLCKKRPDAP